MNLANCLLIMPHTLLLSLLEGYSPCDANEEAMWLKTLAFVREYPAACFERSLAIGHVTASAWVVSPDYGQVLLMHHAKLNKWFQPGGHCDGDPDVLGVALKETWEETGVKARPVHPNVFDVDVHPIPATAREAGHDHYDIRFLLVADPKGLVEANAESKEVRWVPMREVARYNASESLLRMQRKCLANT